MLKLYRERAIPSAEIRLAVTNQCNLSCKYCHKEGQKNNSKKEINAEEILKIAKLAKRRGARKIRLTGGEPLIREDILEILKKLKKMRFEEVGLNTNGVLLPKFYKKLKINRIAMGVDGIRNGLFFKDKWDYKNTFEIIRTIQKLKKVMKFQAITVYSKRNEKEILNLIEFSRNEKIDLKILEKDLPAKENSNYFEFMHKIIKKYNMKKGVIVGLKEYFAVHKNGARILFFPAHCKRKECDICSICI